MVGMIENGKRMEKWEDKKDFNFPYLCLVGRVEKWRDEKRFCLVEKRNEMIENKVCINLLICPY